MIFPLKFFPATDYHNIYTDAIQTLLLKTKCDIVIDTQTSGVLPGADITYMHYPLWGRLKGFSKTRRAYFIPYHFYECYKVRNSRRIILSNSRYTASAISRILGVESIVLYPPISKTCYINNGLDEKENIVLSAGRIEPDKKQIIIPKIASLTNKKIRFLIVGSVKSQLALKNIYEAVKRYGVSDRVKVLNELSREEYLNLLKKSKVFIHPAQEEHFGIVVAEAMASGCIPVVHNSGGPKEFVPEYFRFTKVEEAAKIIEKAILEWSPQLAMRFVRIAQSFREENFSKNFLKIFNSYVQILSQ